MDRTRDLDLLLLGKTGNGKSRTGNSILGRLAFAFSPNSTSTTKEIASGVAEYGGRCIKVVDGPGVGDTSGSEEEANRFVMKQLSEAIAINDKGYHAFLLVVRFGTCFTREDKQSVDYLKDIFGTDFVKNYCILLLTCGDEFEDYFGESKTIKGWCQEQKGSFKDLYEECNRRVILFDNKTKDAGKKKAQVDELIKMVDDLCISGKRYTNEHFATAEATRKRRMVEDKVAFIHQDTMDKISLIFQDKLKINQTEDLKERKGQLQQLLPRCKTLLAELKTKDCGTGVVNEVFKNVTSIIEAVINDIDQCSEFISNTEHARAKEKQEMQEKKSKLDKQQELLANEKQEMQAKAMELDNQKKALAKKELEVQATKMKPDTQKKGLDKEKDMQQKLRAATDAGKTAERQRGDGASGLSKQKMGGREEQDQWKRKVCKRDEGLVKKQTESQKSNDKSIAQVVAPVVAAGLVAAVTAMTAPAVAAIGSTAAVVVGTMTKVASASCVVS